MYAEIAIIFLIQFIPLNLQIIKKKKLQSANITRKIKLNFRLNHFLSTNNIITIS